MTWVFADDLCVLEGRELTINPVEPFLLKATLQLHEPPLQQSGLVPLLFCDFYSSAPSHSILLRLLAWYLKQSLEWHYLWMVISIKLSKRMYVLCTSAFPWMRVWCKTLFDLPGSLLGQASGWFWKLSDIPGLCCVREILVSTPPNSRLIISHGIPGEANGREN